jgi:hypothetical protein
MCMFGAVHRRPGRPQVAARAPDRALINRSATSVRDVRKRAEAPHRVRRTQASGSWCQASERHLPLQAVDLMDQGQMPYLARGQS